MTSSGKDFGNPEEKGVSEEKTTGINAEKFLEKITDKDGIIDLSLLKKIDGGGTHDIYRSEENPDVLLKIMKHTIGKNEIELSLGHSFGKALKSTLYFDSEFGSGTTDHAIMLDNSHDFVIEDLFAKDSKTTITPSFSISAA